MEGNVRSCDYTAGVAVIQRGSSFWIENSVLVIISTGDWRLEIADIISK